MEHFSVIQSLIRMGLSGDQVGFEKQVTRLRSRLVKAKDDKSVATIDRLLSSVMEVKSLEPSDVDVSRTLVFGETLTCETHPPIDRETGARLCEVVFADQLMSAQPVYDENVDLSIGGLLAEWSASENLKQLGVDPTRSLLIFGPPGSGKTMTAHHIASRLGLPMVLARIDGLISSFLGTTARNIANLFDFANRYRCVLLLDEFDAIAKIRDDPQEVGEIKRVVNTLLQNLDARHDFGVTIAITNHDRLLDPAVWRRFETQLHITEPGGKAREAMIARYLEPLTIEAPLALLLSYCLKDKSGADIERICSATKRTLAINDTDHNAHGIFSAFAAVSARQPYDEHTRLAFFSNGTDEFITAACNDPEFELTQKDLAPIVGRDQSTISRLKKMGEVAQRRE